MDRISLRANPPAGLPRRRSVGPCARAWTVPLPPLGGCFSLRTPQCIQQQQQSASSFRAILLPLAFSPCQLKNARSVVEWSIHYPAAAAPAVAADRFALPRLAMLCHARALRSVMHIYASRKMRSLKILLRASTTRAEPIHWRPICENNDFHRDGKGYVVE